MENFVSIGYTRKPVGIKGELRIHIEDRYLEDFLQTQVLFVEVDGASIPYFVESVRVAKTPIVKFEDIDSPEAAQVLGGKTLSLRASDLLPDEEREFEVDSEDLVYAHLVGFSLYNQTQKVGEIQSILEFPQQEMAVVQYQEREVLIPLNDQLIETIDLEDKQVIVQLPEGLLSL